MPTGPRSFPAAGHHVAEHGVLATDEGVRSRHALVGGVLDGTHDEDAVGLQDGRESLARDRRWSGRTSRGPRGPDDPRASAARVR